MAFIGTPIEIPGYGSTLDRHTGLTTSKRQWVLRCSPGTETPATARAAVAGNASTSGEPLATQDCSAYNGEIFGFVVTNNYAFPAAGQGQAPTGVDPDPLLRPWIVTYNDQITNEAWFKDNTAPTPKKYLNTAGVPFSDKRNRQRTIGTMTLVKNFAIYDDAAYQNFRDTVCNADLVIKGITYTHGMLLMREINGEPVYEVNTLTGIGLSFYKVTFNIAKEPRKHQPISIDSTGFKQSGAAPGAPTTPIMLPVGVAPQRPITLSDGPWPLDVNGKPKPLQTDTPEPIIFNPYVEASWTSLNFPAT